ncbi:MAG: phosphoenolpyruvate synthase [bacterium]
MSNKETAFILWFHETGIEDIPYVGGKNAALGEMFANLTSLGINVPNGFAVTAHAYRYFLEEAGLKKGIKEALTGLDTHNIKDLQKIGKKVRDLILKADLPSALKAEIETSYKQLSKLYKTKNADVAVRSSATAEDLPDSSFAGQQETYLNIVGIENVLQATKECISSLFTDRAISYREDKGFSHFDIALSVTVQKMVRSDVGASGVMFTIDTETGFDKIVVINSSYGLGEMVVQGKVTPDEFMVFKPMLEKSYNAIIAKNIGPKTVKMVYAPKGGGKQVAVDKKDQEKFSISEEEIIRLADWGVKIEKHFSKKHNRYQPMDIEWAKDGKTKQLFIVQARPETIHSTADKNVYYEYRLKEKGEVLLQGTAVGAKIGAGKVRVIKDVKNITEFQKGEVLVTKITDPDWEPIMKIASAIVTDQGGRTSHAAIVSRELGIPCIVGSKNATTKLEMGQDVTVDCSSKTGIIYKGNLSFEVLEHHLDKIPETKTKVMANIGSPDDAFRNYYLPAKGVGLGRLEFIIASHIAIHPNALIDYPKLKKQAVKDTKIKRLVKKIDEMTVGYKDKTDYYVDELAEGIAKIGATFWPNEVIIRFSDFKTNEYRTLLGGDLYEPMEENPMIGWRGASRYYDPKFKDAFGLECMALKKVRYEMGLKNVTAMIPFCRTPEEGKKVIAIMEENGLDRKTDTDLKVYVMCEIPSNIMLADEFLDVFDGMSIGSNDLTQLTMGMDRDSGIVAHIANENNMAVKTLIADVIKKCRARGKYIGICGQAPSDYPEFATFLVEAGIESMSLNPDVIIKTIIEIAAKEKALGIA